MLADELVAYSEALQGVGAPVHVVTLLPSLEVALARDAGRSAAVPDRVRALHAEFAREADAGLLPGAVLDTSRDADEHYTADRVQDAVASGKTLTFAGPVREGGVPAG